MARRAFAVVAQGAWQHRLAAPHRKADAVQGSSCARQQRVRLPDMKSICSGVMGTTSPERVRSSTMALWTLLKGGYGNWDKAAD